MEDQMLKQSCGLLPESAIPDQGLSLPANPSHRVAPRSKRGGPKTRHYAVREGTGFGRRYRVNSMQYFSKNWVVRIFNKTVNVFVGRCNQNNVLLPEKVDA